MHRHLRETLPSNGHVVHTIPVCTAAYTREAAVAADPKNKKSLSARCWFSAQFFFIRAN